MSTPMSMIMIQSKNETPDGWKFDVETAAGTSHMVTVDQGYFAELTNGEASAEELITASFAYLLEREPANAILAEFNLQDIETYFPEYPEQITERL